MALASENSLRLECSIWAYAFEWAEAREVGNPTNRPLIPKAFEQMATEQMAIEQMAIKSDAN